MVRCGEERQAVGEHLQSVSQRAVVALGAVAWACDKPDKAASCGRAHRLRCSSRSCAAIRGLQTAARRIVAAAWRPRASRLDQSPLAAGRAHRCSARRAGRRNGTRWSTYHMWEDATQRQEETPCRPVLSFRFTSENRDIDFETFEVVKISWRRF